MINFDPSQSIYDSLIAAALAPSPSVRRAHLDVARHQLDVFRRLHPHEMVAATRLSMWIQDVAEQAKAH